MEATASSARRTGSTRGGEDSRAVASVGGNPAGSAGCATVVSVGGNPAVCGVGGCGDSEGGRGAAGDGRAAASRRESDWRAAAAAAGLRWAGLATGLNLFWLAAGGQCGGGRGGVKSQTHGDGGTSRAVCGCNNSKTKIIDNNTPRIPLPAPTSRLPILLLSLRAYPPKASANPVCAFACSVSSPTHTLTLTLIRPPCLPQLSSAQHVQQHSASLPLLPASPPPPQSSPSQTKTSPCPPERRSTRNVRLSVLDCRHTSAICSQTNTNAIPGEQ